MATRSARGSPGWRSGAVDDRPERLEDARPDRVGPGRAARRGHHEPEQRVADVGVLEPDLGPGDQRRRVREQGPQALLVEERPAQLPVVAVGAVAGQARGVLEQLAQREGGDAVGRAAGPGHPPGERVVQREHAPLGQLEHDGGREGLGVRGDPEHRGRRQRCAGLDVGQAVGGLQEHLPVQGEGPLHPGHAVVAAPVGPPGVHVGGGPHDEVSVQLRCAHPPILPPVVAPAPTLSRSPTCPALNHFWVTIR